MLKQNASRTATELVHIKRSVQNKHVKTEIKRTFEIGVEKGLDVPSDVIVGFMRREKFQHQKTTIHFIKQVSQMLKYYRYRKKSRSRNVL